MTLEQLLLQRLRRHRQILFSPEDSCLQPLRCQLAQCSRRSIVGWALELAEETALQLEHLRPRDGRPRAALEAARCWARGELKMPIARHAILACHAAAKECTDPVQIAMLHAVGQACSTVHTSGHALGYPLYDLTAGVLANGPDEEWVLCRLAHCQQVLERHQEAPGNGPWASFLTE